MPPQPDGGVGWDPSSAVASASGSSDSAQKSLWDLNGLDWNTPITVQYGQHANPKKLSNRLDPYDRQDAIAGTPPTMGLPADLVKRPIVLYGSDPKSYLALQQALFAGGFYGTASAKSVPWGSDPAGATYDAWKRVLAATQQAQSAGLNITAEQVLQQGIQQHQAAVEAGGQPKAPLVIQTTDPATLAGLVQRAAQDSIGRNLSKDEVNRFIQSFHAQEAEFSKRRYTAEQDTTGATVTLTQPDATAQAQQFVEGGHPNEAAAQQEADYIGVLHQLLGG